MSHLFPDKQTPPRQEEGKLALSPGSFLEMLHNAVQDDDTKRYFYLVEQGADPLLRLPCDTSKDDIEYMEECGYRVYRPDLGLMHHALKQGMAAVVRDLLERGEDPNGPEHCPGEHLRTWLFSRHREHYDLDREQWLDCGLALLEHGADPYYRGARIDAQEGESGLPSAMDMAQRYESHEAVGLMKSFIEQKELEQSVPAARMSIRRRL